ncbi:hypothetical protein DPMN_156048 [Dreissena polymorpha]|uniref:Uncharacterized protein n=1 Tax=Dreissena polymorpha TaxID=45954 RepID=A0A9D4JBY5_DREPO|nr:hypothetical protein DPMN_156048 [Dreissena polymorpha]
MFFNRPEPFFNSSKICPNFKFHEDWEKIVSYRLFICCHYIHIKKTAPLPGGHVFSLITTIFKLVRDIQITNVTSRVKNAPPLGSHVFQAKVTIFELIQYIIGINHLSNFHIDRKINVASRVLTRKNTPLPGGHVFQPTDIIFELVQDIIGLNLLTKVLTSHIGTMPRPFGSHVFQANLTIFGLIQDIIETNLQTEFHEDWTINVASRE